MCEGNWLIPFQFFQSRCFGSLLFAVAKGKVRNEGALNPEAQLCSCPGRTASKPGWGHWQTVIDSCCTDEKWPLPPVRTLWFLCCDAIKCTQLALWKKSSTRRNFSERQSSVLWPQRLFSIKKCVKVRRAKEILKEKGLKPSPFPWLSLMPTPPAERTNPFLLQYPLARRRDYARWFNSALFGTFWTQRGLLLNLLSRFGFYAL